MTKAGCVYFIETLDGAFVKIGYSTQPHERRRQLRTRPGKHALRLIGWLPGTFKTERWLHAKFSADRDSGEWFKTSELLRQFIAVIGLINVPEPLKRQQAKPVIMEPIEAKLAIKREIGQCLRCGHGWFKRIEGRPKHCPKCKQHNWDVPKGKIKMGRPKKRNVKVTTPARIPATRRQKAFLRDSGEGA